MRPVQRGRIERLEHSGRRRDRVPAVVVLYGNADPSPEQQAKIDAGEAAGKEVRILRFGGGQV